MTAVYQIPAPARTARPIAALQAAVILLERLGHLAVLHISVHTEYSPNLPVILDAQVAMVNDDDLDPDDALGDGVRLDRLNAMSVALGQPIRHAWTASGMHAFALAGFDLDGVPVHLWTAFTNPQVITRADALTGLPRR